jgi:Flp pilus assembly protein TadD
MLSVVDHVTRKQYAFEFTAEARSIPRMAAQSWEVLKAAAAQWTPWLGWIALPGAWLAFRRARLFGLLLAATFGATTFGFVVLLNFDLEREKLTAYRLFYLPAYVVSAIWIGLALDAAGRACLRLRPSLQPRLAWGACALALAPLILFWRENDKSSCRVVRLYTEAVLTTLPERAIIFPSGDHASFPLIYIQGVERRRLDITIADKYGYTDPELLHDVPLAVKAGIGRIPSQAEDMVLQDWLISTTDRPVYFTTKRSLAGLRGYRLEPEGLLCRVVRPGELFVPREDLWAKYDLSFLDDRPRDYTADVVASEVLLARGVHRARQKDIVGAKADLEASAEASRGIKQGLNNLGSACAENELIDEAERFFQEAVRLDGKYVTALRNLARVQMALRRWSAALETIDRLLALDPKDRAARLQRVEFLRATGQTRLAVFELDKLASDEPKNISILIAAGDLSLEVGDNLVALTFFQRALSLEPANMDLLDRVQRLLQAPTSAAAQLNPFRPIHPPGVPFDPFQGLRPPGFGSDPLDPRGRR